MKRIVAGLFVAAALTSACSSPRSEPAHDAPPVPVTIANAAMSEIGTRFEAGGIVRAAVTTLVASRVMAPVTAVHVRPGDRVRRGATLVALDAREIEANRSRADATSVSAAESVRAAEADLRSAESAVVLARATHDRIRGLFAKRSSTAQELDQAVASLSAAEAQVEAARARLSAATAARDAARAGADSARINVSYSLLAAPFDGVVTERRVDPGALATPGTPLVVLEDATSFRLEVPLDEARAGFVTIGQPVDVRIDEPSDSAAPAWVQGRVTEIARLDPASHTFLVKIDLPAGACTRSGVFGRARFAGPVRRALVVPRSAVIPRGQLSFVYLIDGDSRARLRAVSAGAEDGERREVLAGVHEKDAVVVNPPAALTDGARVAGGAR